VIDRLASSRLVTLIGPGGIGKTSLALEAVRVAERQPDTPAIWVSLEGAEGGDLMLAVALAMGLQPRTSTNIDDLVAGYAGERRYVLLLDGCERLVDGVAAMAHRLLRSCRQMRIVATSRVPLGMPGEAAVHVDALEADAARKLLCERAGLDPEQLPDRSEDKITAVCAALDGMPLAIELAAARLRSLSLDHLVRLLDDQTDLLRRTRADEPRLSSMAANLHWSYEYLDEEQRRAFRLLSIFRDQFEIEAAATVATGRAGVGVVDRLVEASLIQPPDGSGLYRMLEPIRQYARFLLEQSDEEDEARALHAEWCVTRCRQFAVQPAAPHTTEIAHWVDRNRLEIAAALDWSVVSGKPEIGASILATVGRELANAGFGGLLLPAARNIVCDPAAVPSRDLAVAMAHTTQLLHLTLDNGAARDMIDRAEGLARRLDDSFALGTVLARKTSFIADVYETGSDGLNELLQAVSLLEDGDRIDPLDYYNVALAALAAGDADLAVEYSRRGLAWEEKHLGRSMGDHESVTAVVAVWQGDLEKAISLKRRAAILRTDQHVLLYAHADWVDLAAYLTYAERYEEATGAIAAAAEIGQVAGINELELTAPRMRVAAATGDLEAVLRHADGWFRRAGDTTGPLSFRIRDSEVVLRGDHGLPAPFLDVLLPLARVLHEIGDVEPACRFARSAPRLMAETVFEAWDQVGDTDRWRDLAAACSGEHCRDGDFSLEHAFEEAASIVRTARRV
jgi:predicted ATPase